VVKEQPIDEQARKSYGPQHPTHTKVPAKLFPNINFTIFPLYMLTVNPAPTTKHQVAFPSRLVIGEPSG
jgi:hypothetical protein